MSKGSHSVRAQRVDHGGDFIQLPRPLLRSAAFLSLSSRARCALLVLLERFSGFNNGRIGLAIDHLGAALGNQNHRANSRALAELIERGFVECMADANHVKSKAREYRLTFIESGHGENGRPRSRRALPPRRDSLPAEVETWKKSVLRLPQRESGNPLRLPQRSGKFPLRLPQREKQKPAALEGVSALRLPQPI